MADNSEEDLELENIEPEPHSTSNDIVLDNLEPALLSISRADLDSVTLVSRTDRSNPRPIGRPNHSQPSVSKLVGGIDEDIKKIFLTLAHDKLFRVFQRYGREFGTSKLIFAKNTYPHWKSGRVPMNGMVVARLLNLLPAELDSNTQFELVKKLRSAYLRKEHIVISCDTSNWFRRVPKVVDALVNNSSQFQLPIEVTEKLRWLMNGDALAAHELLVAAEVDEAKVRTKFLEHEYARISRMLAHLQGADCINHTIELPQGTIAVTISKRKIRLLQRLPMLPTNEKLKKRTLSIVCKNPLCGSEVETKLSVYDGEPVLCSPGEVTCTTCGTTHVYDERDLSRSRRNLNVEIRRGLLGNQTISYDCPHCSTRLQSPYEEAGASDNCPKCRAEFVVPTR